MMWKLFFLFIATVAASDYDEEHFAGCRSTVHRECENESPEFPSSEEELEGFCKFISNYIECTSKLVDQCDEENEDDAEFAQVVQEFNTVFTRVCDKDALLYSALAANLHCIEKEGNQILNHCSETGEEGLQTFSETLSSRGITDIDETDNDKTSVRCMTALYVSSCFASRIGKFCGNVARDAVLEFILGFDSPFANCRPGVKDNIPTIAQVMQLEAEKEEDVENMMKKKKK